MQSISRTGGKLFLLRVEPHLEVRCKNENGRIVSKASLYIIVYLSSIGQCISHQSDHVPVSHLSNHVPVASQIMYKSVTCQITKQSPVRLCTSQSPVKSCTSRQSDYVPVSHLSDHVPVANMYQSSVRPYWSEQLQVAYS